MSHPNATDADFDARFARIESLLGELARASDPRLEQATREILATLLELHQRGLSRVLEIAATDARTQDELALDPRVSAMLLLHGLHPIALAERVSRTVEQLRERFRSKVLSASVETRDSAIVVRVVPAASACSSTRASLQKDWQEALLAAAPDLESLSIELAAATPALVTLRLGRDAAAPAVQASGAAR